MRYVQAPEIYQKQDDRKSIFFAGGISGCPNWQLELSDMIRDMIKDKDVDIDIINPRRKNQISLEGNIAKEQIKWEHEHLDKADIVSFWFPKETLCPITLLELGKYLMRKDKHLIIGIEPGYQRKFDVEFQTYLERPEVEIVYDLYDLAMEIEKYV